MIHLFVSLEALTNISLMDGRWNKILRSEIKQVNVDASENELAEILSMDASESPILNLIQQGDIELISSSNTIAEFKQDHSKVLNYPSGVFFLDIPKEDAAEIQRNYGVICKNDQDIDDKELSNSREISCIEGDLDHCWEEFLSGIKKVPTNSIVIADRYLFANDDENKREGGNNLIDIVNSILPPYFSSDASYHVLLIYSQENGKKQCKLKFNKLAKELTRNIQRLRTYRIDFELVSVSENQRYYEGTHNRRIITNYHLIRTEHKLNAFAANKSLCTQVLNWDELFSKGVADGSDTPYKTHKMFVKLLGKVSDYGTSCKTSGYCYSLNQVCPKDENNKIIFSKIQNRLIANQ